MQPEEAEIRSLLSAQSVEGFEITREKVGLVLRLPALSAVPALAALRVGGFDMMVDHFGTDTGEAVEITYHLRSFVKDEELFIKTDIPYGGEIASGWEVYPALVLPERETAEMFCLTLAGHPNPKRLFTTEATPDGPLLKETRLRSHEEARDARR